MPITPFGYQKSEDAPKHDEKLTDLAVIGVPPEYQDKPPHPEAYPIKWNPEAKDVWCEMLQSREFNLKCSGQTIDGQWHQAIQLFLELCSEYGVSPFWLGTDSARNDYIVYSARNGRMRIVKFLNDIQLFSHPDKPLRVRTAYREYVRTDEGFIINSWADCYPYIEETRLQFETRMTDFKGPRFLKYVENHLVKVLIPPVQVWIKSFNMLRLQVGFTIEMKGTINIPGHPSPTRKEVDAWFDRLVWFPLVRSHRIDGVWNRLF